MERELNYKDKFQAFYNSKDWKNLRALKFADANGLCEKCLKVGKVVQGVDVHHIKPIEFYWNKRLDYYNLILLCKDCHNEIHNRESSLQKFLRDWDNMEKEKIWEQK